LFGFFFVSGIISFLSFSSFFIFFHCFFRFPLHFVHYLRNFFVFFFNFIAILLFRCPAFVSFRSSVHAHHPFARSVFGEIFVNHFRKAYFTHLRQFFPQRLAHIGHFVEVGFAVLMYPFQHLLGTELLLTQIGKEGFHFGGRQPQQINFFVAFRHQQIPDRVWR